MQAQTTVNPGEVEKFSAMAEEWWDPKGKFRPLHQLNPVRIDFIRDAILKHYHREASKEKSLEGLTLLDVGCGGGLVAEPMARMGATVTAIDASEKNIGIASAHANMSHVAIDYRCTTTEDLLQASDTQYDVVLALEIVEHVADVPMFLESCTRLVKPGGILLLATLNRTMMSFLFAIVGAEYVLRWLPKGTHEWSAFLKPSELVSHLRANKMGAPLIQGLTYQPLLQEWRLSTDTRVNYMLCASKPI